MLARALKRAKTKEEAQRAVAQANLSVLSEMQKGGGEAPSLHGVGGGSSEGTSSSVMTAGGGMGDALDAPVTEDGAAASATGEVQSGSPVDARVQSGEAQTAEHTDAAHGSPAEEHKEKEGFQPGPSTRDQYGNRRVLSREEMDDMLRQAQESGKLTPLDTEKVYLLRALQREWMEYANSEAYKNLPNTVLDAAAEKEHGVRRKKHEEQDAVPVRVHAPTLDALLAAKSYYHAAHGAEPFEAKG